MSDFYICNSDLCPFSNFLIGVQFSNLWLFLTVSNRYPITSLRYALTLTSKSAIDLRIWKGRIFQNTLKSGRDLRWCQWMPIWGVDVELSPYADLSLSYVFTCMYNTFVWSYLEMVSMLNITPPWWSTHQRLSLFNMYNNNVEEKKNSTKINKLTILAQLFGHANCQSTA